MNKTMLFLIGAVLLSDFSRAADMKLKVKHEHGLRSCQGTLTFGDSTVTYEASEKKHSRIWKYPDIQQIGLLEPKKVAVLTYEDRKLALGKDRIFNFDVLEGDAGEALVAFLEKHLTKPIVSAVIPQDAFPRFKIPAKHLSGWGGTEGTIEITDEYLAFRSLDRADSRFWRYENISSLGSTGPFEFRLTAMERVGGEHGGMKDFVFDLKERLREETYDFIWWKVNGPRISPPQP